MGQSYFKNDTTQLNLTFQLFYYILKRLSSTKKAVSWKLKGFPAETLTNANTTDNSLSPSIKWYKRSSYV